MDFGFNKTYYTNPDNVFLPKGPNWVHYTFILIMLLLLLFLFHKAPERNKRG